MSTLKFYYVPGACSLAVHILLHESSTDFAAIRMPVLSARVKLPADFAKINSKIQVPVLCISSPPTDIETITEVPAISTYISNLVPDMHLMGKTQMDKVRVYEWFNYLSGNLHTGGFAHVFRPGRWSDDEGSWEAIGKSARGRIRGCFEFIEERLMSGVKKENERQGKSDFGGKVGEKQEVHAVGNAFTAIDAYLLVFWRWGGEIRFDMKKQYPLYRKLVEGVVSKESVRSVLEIEAIEVDI